MRVLGEVFLRVLGMSLAGGAAVLAVCAARLALRRAPAWLPCLLWAAVLARLLCPFGLPLLPAGAGVEAPLAAWSASYAGEARIYHDDTPEYQRAVEAGREPLPAGEGGQYVVTAPDGVSAPATVADRVLPALGLVWLAGAAGMLLAGLAGWLRLRRRLADSVRLAGNVYLADRIEGPFVMGLFRPRIYLPAWLGEAERALVLRHERAHIRGLDHLTRPLAWAALCLHWFNPLVWLGFARAGRDMEMRCDEAATRGLPAGQRADYAAALLRFAAGRGRPPFSPAFSEGDAGARIRRLARWKRPAAWAVGLAAALCVLLAVGLLASPAPESAAPVSMPASTPAATPAGSDPPAPDPAQAEELAALRAEQGFAADADPYALWGEGSQTALTLWFDPARGVGCGQLLDEAGNAETFRFDETGPGWYDEALALWPADPFDPACALAPDPETAVTGWREETERDEAGRLVRYEAGGYWAEAGETLPVRRDEYTYREDGTLARRDYYHNDRLFGSWLYSCRLWYDAGQRLTRVRGYVTHGQLDYFYFYGEDGAPAWQLCLDHNGGLLDAWMTPL